MTTIKILKEQDYKKYADFIVTNLNKVTTGLKVGVSPTLMMTFEEILNMDKSTAILIFWKMLEQENLTLFVFEKNNKVISFAVMEPTRLLRYLFVDESQQKQGIGSEIIKYFKQNGNFRVKIEEKEYKNGLQNFYIKNGFKFLQKKPFLGIMYYEYTLDT
jgi:GNAT superfamily N-acetyltransferase